MRKQRVYAHFLSHEEPCDLLQQHASFIYKALRHGPSLHFTTDLCIHCFSLVCSTISHPTQTTIPSCHNRSCYRVSLICSISSPALAFKGARQPLSSIRPSDCLEQYSDGSRGRMHSNSLGKEAAARSSPFLSNPILHDTSSLPATALTYNT